MHLRNAGHRAMKQHGYGVGYRFPPDFEGSDITQRYLPDELAERCYYLPNDRGYESTIAARMAARGVAREETRRRGRPEREAIPAPKVDGMKAAVSIMRTREESRRRLAETEKRDAGD
jgi:hypothetical protein